MQRFGKYEVVEQIGVGGFGEVYKGYDPFLKRHLAIKTCTADDEEMRRRFFREAEIAGNLHHPNITTVYDFGVEGEVPFLVQEFLSGEDLDRLIRRREFIAYRTKLDYLLQVARGLEYAQAKGVIHRDIKPANIRVLGDGTAKIMDFGIAKLLHRETGLTRAGTTLGTTAYLAPEQIRGDAVDRRTDIFSLGVVAYELLTYERPFRGDTVSAVLFKVLNEAPRPLKVHWPDCPGDAAAVVARCMEKEPDDRFGDCAELVRVLETLVAAAAELPAVDKSAPGSPGDEAAPLAAPEDVVLPSGGPAGGALVDFDLPPSPRPERHLTEAVSAGAARGGKRAAVWGAAALLLAALGLGGWWLARDTPGDERGLAAAPSGEATAGAEPAAADAGPDEAGAPESQPDEAGAPETAADEAPTELPAGAPTGAAGPEEAAVETPVEAPPPPPPPTAVVVSRAWNERMTVTVGGETRPLNRDRRWTLPPGAHELTFELQSLDYTDRETLTVDLAEGQTRRVEAPIRRPARLTVQARMGTPQGDVRLGQASLGSSPVQRRAVRPGTYRLEIVPRAAPAEAVASEVVLDSGADTVVTFDLTGGHELEVRGTGEGTG